MKIGASIWPFQWEHPYDSIIRKVSKLGLKAVELIAWDRTVLDEYYTKGVIRELRSILSDEGLELSQFVSTPPGLASGEKKERDEGIDHFKKLVEVGVGLGTKIVNSVSPYPFNLHFPRITERPLVQKQTVDIPAGLDWKQNWEDYMDSLRKCCAIAENAGVCYSLEPHPYRYLRNTAAMQRILDFVQSDALGMNFDPSHLYPSGEIPHMVIYELGDRIIHAHLSDNDGHTNVHWRPGRGKMDWEAVLRAFKDVGFDGVLSLELEDVPGVSRSNRFGEPERDLEEVLFEEYRKAIDYLKHAAEKQGVVLDVG